MTAETTWPSLAVVVVNYYSADLVRTLAGRLHYRGPLSLVVVDNSVDDDQWRRLHELEPAYTVTLIRQRRNGGFGVGSNVGAARAISDGAELVLLLNPDAYIEADQLEQLVRADMAADHPLMVSPVIRDSDGRVWQEFTALDWTTGHARHVADPGDGSSPPWLSGACLLTSAATWKTVGGFDPDYFLYWEDVDLGVRATRAGVRCHIARDVEAVHDAGGAQGERRTAGKSPAYMRHMVRSRLVFAHKHLSPAGRARWLLTTPVQAFRIARGAGVHRGRTSPARFTDAVCRGLGDGLRALAGRTARPDLVEETTEGTRP